jgi:hypothetical protein
VENTLKNLAVKIAATNSRLDPSQLSIDIDQNFGVQSNQSQASQLGPLNFSLSRDNVGFSVNSFSSLVDFGDLDANKSRRDSSSQQSVNELMPAPGDAEKYHKEYKVYESNDAKRLTSKDWTINYSMNSQTFTPTHEASSELTNNVVTYVQLNEMDEDYDMKPPRVARMSGRQTHHYDDKRQMSVDIKTASIGIDNSVYHEFAQPTYSSFPVNYEHHHQQQQQTQHRPMTQSHAPVLPQTQDSNLLESYQDAHNSPTGDADVLLPYEITQGEVLLERGGKRYYRRLINERRESYQELPDASRAEKMAISLSVVMSVKATGARFIHKKRASTLS